MYVLSFERLINDHLARRSSSLFTSNKRRVLVATGGGDCPGLNAVIRAVVHRMSLEPDWEVVGSVEAFNGILRDPMEVMLLDETAVQGIHIRGGTIIKTTNKGGPFAWPVLQADGTWVSEDRVGVS